MSDELDRRIAEEILGLKAIEGPYGNVYKIDGDLVGEDEFAPSEYIEDAWKVVEAMRGMLFSRRARFMRELQSLACDNKETVIGWPDVFWFVTPEIICKAALRAME